MKKNAMRPFGAALSGMLILTLLSVMGQFLKRQLCLSDEWMLGVRMLTYLTPCLFMHRARIDPISVAESDTDSASPFPPAGFALVCGVGIRYLFLLLQYTNRMPLTAAGAPLDWADVVSALLLAPVLEEVFFRGYLLRGLLPFGNCLAAVISSVFFALQHDSLSGIFNGLLCGMMLSQCSLCRSGLFVCIGVHFLLNGTDLLHSVLPPMAAIGTDAVLFAAGAAVSLGALFKKSCCTDSRGSNNKT